MALCKEQFENPSVMCTQRAGRCFAITKTNKYSLIEIQIYIYMQRILKNDIIGLK